MSTALTTFLAALLGGLAVTPLARRAAYWRGVVDHPDGQRKRQNRPTPLWGGVAVYLALLLGVTAAGMSGLAAGGALVHLGAMIATGAGLVCMIGCVDDSIDLNPRFKLLLQVAATLPVILAGYWVDRIVLFGYAIDLGWIGGVVTLFWLVGCINAFNLLDGMDGLASMVGLLSALVIALVAAVGGHIQVAIIAMALAGALAGFLGYNLPPASIYLGDSGSMVIGLVIGVLAFQGSLGTTAALSITVPAVLLTLPLLDAALAVARRRLSGRPFDAADRGHIHHCLLARGLTQWQTLFVFGLVSVVTGAAAVATAVWRSDLLACTTAVAVVGLLVATRAFGNYELALCRLALAHGVSRALRWLLSCHRIRRSPVRRSTLAGMPFDKSWDLLVDEVRRWQARRLELVMTGDRERPACVRVWLDPGEPPLSCIHWSFSATFSGSNRRICQLTVSGSDAGISQQWALVQLMRVLKPFGEHWAVGPEMSTTAIVSIPPRSTHVPSGPAFLNTKPADHRDHTDREAA